MPSNPSDIIVAYYAHAEPPNPQRSSQVHLVVDGKCFCGATPKGRVELCARLADITEHRFIDCRRCRNAIRKHLAKESS